MNKQLALFVFLSSAVFAQSRFDGTWEMKMDTLQFSRAPEEYLIDHGMYRCLSCVPKVDVKADGTDYKIAGHEAYYDTIAVKIVDANTVNFAFKKDGKMDTVRNSTTAGTLTTFESIPGGLKISDGSQSGVTKFDGDDYPIGKSGHATIALKVVDEYTLEETDKRDGKVMTVARYDGL